MLGTISQQSLYYLHVPDEMDRVAYRVVTPPSLRHFLQSFLESSQTFLPPVPRLAHEDGKLATK